MGRQVTRVIWPTGSPECIHELSVLSGARALARLGVRRPAGVGSAGNAGLLPARWPLDDESVPRMAGPRSVNFGMHGAFTRLAPGLALECSTLDYPGPNLLDVTVLEVIQRSGEFLARKGVDSPRLQIELLLAHVLGMPRMKLYLNFDRVLSVSELDALRGLVKRRGGREPLQYLTGSTSFCGLELRVNREVLIPRPETELLAERAIEYLRSQRVAAPKAGLRRVLDLGTGSGCLAIAIAVGCPEVMVHALDQSAGALAIARENAAVHGVEGRVQFHCGDGLAAAPSGEKFDLLVSNPPYIATSELATLQREVRDFEPHLALDGGNDGLVFFRLLGREAGGRLEKAAPMMLEVAAGQAQAVSRLLREAGWEVDAPIKDYGGHERILIARRLD